VKDNKSEKGMTLVEVIISIVILMIVTVPLYSFLGTMGTASKVHDLHIAYALLRGETAIMYKKHALPEKDLSVNIDGVDYTISCSEDSKDQGLVSWSMKVKKGNKSITGIKGLLYVPSRQN
jgi:type II secretory pathway pseudopilin PulG